MSDEWKPGRHLGVIRIDELTPSANALRRAFKTPHQYKKLRDRLQQWLMVAMANGKIPRATGRRRLTICRFVRSERYVLDKDNLIGGAKPLVDAATRQGLIKDDTAQWLEAIYLQAISTDQRVEINVEDLGAFTTSTPVDSTLDAGGIYVEEVDTDPSSCDLSYQNGARGCGHASWVIVWRCGGVRPHTLRLCHMHRDHLLEQLTRAGS